MGSPEGRRGQRGCDAGARTGNESSAMRTLNSAPAIQNLVFLEALERWFRYCRINGFE